ncbi:MAG: phosphotransferase, partial [Allobaculum sp.]|nr:phosphotransferase [Allobaculum sp.]
LEDDFEKLAERLLAIPPAFQGFMMRDCQSRNVMITDGGPIFIDFQGGRKGPALYDAVSFLWQARAVFSDDFRKEMLYFYCEYFCEGDRRKMNEMLSCLDDVVLFRTLQVLGAYGFRGLVQRKVHFLISIPMALGNLRVLMENGALDEYPQLKRCALNLIGLDKNEVSHDCGFLTVEIFSFSYKKGYPEDLSGNGGGFMFDCRALHNPGRYERYRALTGKDMPVIDFLEAQGEVLPFLKNAWSLTAPAVERYLSRGFTRLQIGFGCTGGQHRSVYCAERTAEHIKEVFPEVKVQLIHREQSVE